MITLNLVIMKSFACSIFYIAELLTVIQFFGKSSIVIYLQDWFAFIPNYYY